MENGDTESKAAGAHGAAEMRKRTREIYEFIDDSYDSGSEYNNEVSTTDEIVDPDTPSPAHPPKKRCRTTGAAIEVIDLTIPDVDMDACSAHVAVNRVSAQMGKEQAHAKDLRGLLESVRTAETSIRIAGLLDKHSRGVATRMEEYCEKYGAGSSAGVIAVTKSLRQITRLEKQFIKEIEMLQTHIRGTETMRDSFYAEYMRTGACGICMDEFKKSPTTSEYHIERFVCDHAIHTGCLREWHRNTTRGTFMYCPICRKKQPHIMALGRHHMEAGMGGGGLNVYEIEARMGRQALSIENAPSLLDQDDSESECDDPGDDGAYRGRLAPRRLFTTPTPVTRATAAQNIADGMCPFTMRE